MNPMNRFTFDGLLKNHDRAMMGVDSPDHPFPDKAREDAAEALKYAASILADESERLLQSSGSSAV